MEDRTGLQFSLITVWNNLDWNIWSVVSVKEKLSIASVINIYMVIVYYIICCYTDWGILGMYTDVF